VAKTTRSCSHKSGGKCLSYSRTRDKAINQLRFQASVPTPTLIAIAKIQSELAFSSSAASQSAVRTPFAEVRLAEAAK